MNLLKRGINKLVACAFLAVVGSAEAQSLQVTYVGNAGFLVLMGEKKVLVDGGFRGFNGAYLLPQHVQDKFANAQAPFDGIDLILATHAHGDHFDPGLVRRHLRNNPKAIFASTRQATAPLMDLPGRVLSFEASSGKADRKDMAGIQVEAIYLSHGAPAQGTTEILNYGYVVTAGGFSFFHTGDVDPSQCRFDEFRAHQLPERRLDIAFIQHYCLGDDAADRKLVRDGIGARHIFASHYYLTDPPLQTSSVLRQYPDAILFRKEMDTWVAPVFGKQIGAGPYLGQHPPGTTPVIFAPGVVSTGNIHSRLEISADGQEMFWNTVDMKTFSTQILSVKNVNGTWSLPQPPPFAKDGNTRAAVFSPDGKKLFFNVNAGDGWVRKYVEKTDGGWSAARADGLLPSGSSSFTRSGRVYFSEVMKTKIWNTGIFGARYAADGNADVTALGEAINRPNAIDYTPYISPDESFLLFSSNRPLNGDKEEMFIHISFRKSDGTWSAPQRVSQIPGRFPSLSPDGKLLFFCGDDGNIYWADKKILDPFRPVS